MLRHKIALSIDGTRVTVLLHFSKLLCIQTLIALELLHHSHSLEAPLPLILAFLHLVLLQRRVLNTKPIPPNAVPHHWSPTLPAQLDRTSSNAQTSSQRLLAQLLTQLLKPLNKVTSLQIPKTWSFN